MDYALSRHECNMLRGLAIIGIFLHNFCHWLAPIVKENEYTYTQYHVDGLLQVTLHPDGNLPIHLLSFFGHYGFSEPRRDNAQRKRRAYCTTISWLSAKGVSLCRVDGNRFDNGIS